ncbi:TdeIII family type II restriction endonuclease [Priestia megaterium]|uniref:TdeIII family type II restriction endonuclease n=1 Tax=Priestia megaterium TaxID=1404 RepID=UPI00203A3DB0|nr:TdeIII family type II restriction endonuclease [Priestia megaterium]MCM3195814.1 TdeIII family type II restriction endonuclease [Priestia megaterium]
MDTELKLKIKKKIEKSIHNYFIKKSKKEINHRHVLDGIFPRERRIRSLIGGLETSMGRTLWEPLAKFLAKNNGYEIIEGKLMMPENVPAEVVEIYNEFKPLRESESSNVSLMQYVEALRNVLKNIDTSELKYKKMVSGKGVDIWIRKNGVEYAFDIKTTQINAGDGKKFNSFLMDWYMYRLCQNPNMEFHAKIAMPFNPYKKSWWSHNGSRAYPLEPKRDLVIEDEFWDFLSGFENTWGEINKIFEEIGAEDFGSQFNNIFNLEIKSEQLAFNLDDLKEDVIK